MVIPHNLMDKKNDKQYKSNEQLSARYFNRFYPDYANALLIFFKLLGGIERLWYNLHYRNMLETKCCFWMEILAFLDKKCYNKPNFIPMSSCQRPPQPPIPPKPLPTSMPMFGIKTTWSSCLSSDCHSLW